MQSIKKFIESLYYPTLVYGKMRSYAQPYISTQFSIHEIVPGLYLGDFASACNKEKLQQLQITHVVTAILGVDEMFPEDFIYLTLPLRDVKSENIYTVFANSSEFIKQAINNNGRVLVHCICGVSRSSTLVAAYLIKEYGFTPDQAIEFIQSKRNIVKPNSGFRAQLELFDAHLHNKPHRRHSI